MSRSQAWLVESTENFRFACGLHEFIEIVQTIERVSVPGAAAHCQQLAKWRDRWVPVMNPAGIMGQQIDPAKTAVGVLCYQTEPKTPLQYGAISLHEKPEKIFVDDDQVCPIPTAYFDFDAITLSCFDHYGITIPIFNLSLLFSLPASTYTH